MPCCFGFPFYNKRCFFPLICLVVWSLGVWEKPMSFAERSCGLAQVCMFATIGYILPEYWRQDWLSKCLLVCLIAGWLERLLVL